MSETPKFYTKPFHLGRAELVHFYDTDKGFYIASRQNQFSVQVESKKMNFRVPLSGKVLVGKFYRPLRRLLRTDKSNAVFNYHKDGVVVLYQGKIYFYDLKKKSLSLAECLVQCRNVLHGGIAVTPRGLFFGEYGANPERKSVPIWQSLDDGRSWEVVGIIPEKKVKHIHGVYPDSKGKGLWITTGDFENECFLCLVPDYDFQRLEYYGDGSQVWRTVGLLFGDEKIIWAMDSQLQRSQLQIWDRSGQKLITGKGFPGPVWYCKQFVDGSAVLQTTVEKGPGVRSNCAHLYFSSDLVDWIEVGKFRKDRWPMPYFKNGVVGFADGPQSSDLFPVHGEGVDQLDGKAVLASII